jgi:hypothetical protein
MWAFGPHNSSHFLKNQTREFLFREAILSFFGVKREEEDILSVYCQSCKKANPNIDCNKCSKKVEVLTDERKRQDRTIN